MTKPIPTIQRYMTTTPHSIGRDQTIARASQVMGEHHIRHLPVLHGGAIVGMLTSRDIALVEGLRDVDPETLRVEDAMSTEVYTVSPDAKLDEVAREMANKRYGSAVVMQNGHLVGIVTTVDLCNALAELLETRLAS